MAALRVLVVAEGPSELGELDQLAGHLRHRTRGRSCEGYIPAMLRKLLPSPLEIEAQRVTRIGRYGARPRLPGDGDRAASALALAEAKGCAVLVFVRDVDKEHGSKRSAVERRRKLTDMHAQIDKGFEAATSRSVIPVKATPCRMIEAWALADIAALTRVGADAKQLETLPQTLEDAWGLERDPRSNHPKCLLRRILDRAPTSVAFEEIARESDPDTLAARCPDSFAPFLAEVRDARKRLAAARAATT